MFKLVIVCNDDANRLYLSVVITYGGAIDSPKVYSINKSIRDQCAFMHLMVYESITRYCGKHMNAFTEVEGMTLWKHVYPGYAGYIEQHQTKHVNKLICMGVMCSVIFDGVYEKVGLPVLEPSMSIDDIVRHMHNTSRADDKYSSIAGYEEWEVGAMSGMADYLKSLVGGTDPVKYYMAENVSEVKGNLRDLLFNVYLYFKYIEFFQGNLIVCTRDQPHRVTRVCICESREHGTALVNNIEAKRNESIANYNDCICLMRGMYTLADVSEENRITISQDYWYCPC